MIMIPVKEAVRKSVRYLNDLIEDNNLNPQLEEVELSEDGNFWIITFSFDNRNKPSEINILSYERDYKTITISSKTGELLSMKIRVV